MNRVKTKSRLNGNGNNHGIGNVVHSIRNIMRKDPGVEGDEEESEEENE